MNLEGKKCYTCHVPLCNRGGTLYWPEEVRHYCCVCLVYLITSEAADGKLSEHLSHAEAKFGPIQAWQKPAHRGKNCNACDRSISRAGVLMWSEDGTEVAFCPGCFARSTASPSVQLALDEMNAPAKKPPLTPFNGPIPGRN